VYAIYTGTDSESRSKNLSTWLKIYHDQYSHELSTFGFDSEKVYAYSKFLKDFHELFPIGISWAFMVTGGSEKTQFCEDNVYHQILTGLINEAIMNNYI